MLVATVLAITRNGGPPFTDILYAEDGTVFYAEAPNDGLRSLTSSYAGYMHATPRFASLVMAVLPIEYVAAGYAIVAATLVALLALYVFFASRALLDSWPSRALAAGVMVLPPWAGQTIANTTNLLWYLIFATFWAVAIKPRSASWAVAGSTIGAIAALSDRSLRSYCPPVRRHSPTTGRDSMRLSLLRSWSGY